MTTTTPTTKRSKTPALVHATAFVQAVIALAFYLTGADDPATAVVERPQQSVVIVLATTLLTNGWAVGEYLFRALARGRKVLLLTVVGLNVGAFGQSGCASFDAAMPRAKGQVATFGIEPDASGPGCTITLYIDDQARDVAYAADCSQLVPCISRE